MRWSGMTRVRNPAAPSMRPRFSIETERYIERRIRNNGYRPKKRLDLYAGVMGSQVAGGPASEYLNHENVGPTVGMHLQ
jgi:hypothetical protein